MQHGGGDPLDLAHERFRVVGLERFVFGVADELLQDFGVGVLADGDGDAHGLFAPGLGQQMLEALLEVVGGLAIVLAYWTLTSLGKNLTDTVYVRKAATLVTHGPYRWVRHPFYITVGLLILSVTLLTANWLIGSCGLVVMTMLVVRTSKEEQMLISRFGNDYRDYMARTGRFFPRISQ